MKTLVLFGVLLLPCLAANPDLEKARTLGNPAAPLTLKVYSDYMCPACKHLHESVLPAIGIDYVKTGKASIVFRESPLDIPQDNFSKQAVAAGRIGKYTIVGDILFARQTWGETGRMWDSVQAVLSPDELKQVEALAKDPAVFAEVQADVARGGQTKIAQVPTIIITNRGRQQQLWSKFNHYTLLRSYLDGLLKK